MKTKFDWQNVVIAISTGIGTAIAALTFLYNLFKKDKGTGKTVKAKGGHGNVNAAGDVRQINISNQSGVSPKEVARIACEMAETLRREHAEQLGCKDKEIEELTKAVKALRASDTSQKRRAEAEAALQRGNTKAADAIFAEIEQSEADKREEHSCKAAEAAKHRGAIAYLNSPKEALPHYERAVGYDPEDTDAWNRIGNLRYRLGDLQEAEDAWNRAQELAKHTNNKEAIAVALGNLGVIARTRGDLPKAEDYLNRAFALDEEIGRKEGMANQLGNLGAIALTRGDLAKAKDYWEDALKLFEAIGARLEIEKVEGLLRGLREE